MRLISSQYKSLVILELTFFKSSCILVNSRRTMSKQKDDSGYFTEFGAGVSYYRKIKEREKQRKLQESQKTKTIASVLEDFVKKGKERHKRLGLLRQAATVVFKEVNLTDLNKIRTSFDEFKDQLFPLEENWCWVCNKQPATQRHHVILLKHGGPPLTKENIVYICASCHSAIHPWLVLTDINQSEVIRIIEVISKVRDGRFTRSQADVELSFILDNLFFEDSIDK